MSSLAVKAMPGTPAYRTQEEYYEQVLELKKVENNSVYSDYSLCNFPIEKYRQNR